MAVIAFLVVLAVLFENPAERQLAKIEMGMTKEEVGIAIGKHNMRYEYDNIDISAPQAVFESDESDGATCVVFVVYDADGRVIEKDYFALSAPPPSPLKKYYQWLRSLAR